MKKIVSMLLSLIFLLSFSVHPCSAEETYNVYSVEDAYAEFKSLHPEFVTSFINQGITEELLLAFLTDVHEYMLEVNSHTPLTPENFEKQALVAISSISSREKFYPIQDALLILYPDAIRQAIADGTVSKDLQPIVATVKKIIFDNNLINSAPASPSVPAFTFSDLPSTHWAFDAVSYLAENFVLNGYLDGTFKPEANITRGEFAKIIVSATNTIDSEATLPFSDVSENDWYYHHVASAYKKGYITGYPDGTFRPNQSITRADICTIVSRCLGNPQTISGMQFKDDMTIPNYAKIPVYALVKKGIINGMGDNKFEPIAFATRAQTAKIIYMAFYN